MKSSKISSVLVVLLLLLASSISPAVAQTDTSGTITYQGYLDDNGAPANGAYNITFTLYDDPTAGTNRWAEIHTGVDVVDGLFTVQLGSITPFGATLFADYPSLYLEIMVGTTALGPRQPLSSAPYAMNAQGVDWNNIASMPAGFDDGTDDNILSGGTINGNVIVNGEIQVTSDSTAARPVYGYASSSTGGTSAVYGLSASTQGVGVTGWANAGANSSSMGVMGRSDSTNGRGIFGVNWATSGNAYGIYGQTKSTVGRGVYGLADSSTGVNSGVMGETFSTSGYGVYGYASATSGTPYGVYGKSDSPTGIGGHFENGSGSGATIGYFERGVLAFGRSIGIYAQSLADPCCLAIAGWFGNPGSTGYLIAAKNGDPNDSTEPNGFDFYVAIDGSVGAKAYNTIAADFAEMVDSGESDLEAGDVLVIGLDGEMHRSTEAYQPTVMGVYSTDPGYIGGFQADENGDHFNPNQVPLAIMGIVPVKVSAENGAIQPGDLMVASSTPGHAMRGGPEAPNGTVIGKAMGALAEGTGTIQMLVMMQ